MKILICGGMFPPIQTGTAFYTHNLACALADRGNEVSIVTLGNEETTETINSADDRSQVTVNRLPAVSLPMKSFFKHFRLSTLSPLNWWRMFKLMRAHDPDVVLLVNHYLDIAFLAVFASWLKRIPLVCSVGTQLQSLNPRRNKILNVLDRAICGTFVFPFCKNVVAWDNQIKAYLHDVQGPRVTDKTVIVHYGVNGNSDALMSKNHEYKKRRNVILGVGAVSEQRSFVPLVQAFGVLLKEFPELKLRIIGHVYYRKAIEVAEELGISHRVEFVGERSHGEVLAEMGNADAFFSSLTGKYVGLGTATIEAMSLGLPTIVNAPLDLFGEQMLVDGEHFIQSADSVPNHIADRIKRLVESDETRERVGQGGRNFVKEHLNWSKVSEDMELVLGNAAGIQTH